MKRLILAAATTALLAAPAAAEPYRSFTNIRTRGIAGISVIRAFPNATTPSFLLLLEQRGNPQPGDPHAGGKCIVWLEFVPRGHPIDHFGNHGRPPEGGNRRELVEAPLTGEDESDEHGNLGVTSYLDDSLAQLHWVARGTNDALQLLRVDVGVDDDGDCVAGTRTLFTPNLAYRDVIDARRLTDYGEARLRGFPADDPTFTLFVEFIEAGTTLAQGGVREVTLTEDLCVLSLELNDAAAPYWHPALAALFDFVVDGRFYLLAHGNPIESETLSAGGSGSDASSPWVSHTTGEALVIKRPRVEIGNDGTECVARARIQFAPRIAEFYR
jgi:hypothetical protein